MQKTLLFSLFFIFIISKLFSQRISFEDYRYKHIDTNNINRLTKKNKSDSLLVLKYSQLYVKKQKVEYLYFLNNIANNYIEKSQIEKARQILNNNLKLAEDASQYSYESAYSYYLLYKTFVKTRNYLKLSKYGNSFNDAVMKLEPDSMLQCISCSFASKCNFMVRDIEKGFAYFDISNTIARKLGLINILQDNYTNAGNVLTFYEPTQASKFLDYAIYLSKSNEYATSYDIVYLYLINGASYLAQDKFDKAIENFQYSLMILKRDSVNNPRFEYTLNYYLASCYKWNKDYDKAINQLEFFKKGNTYSAKGLQVLGDIYFDQKKYDSTLIYYEQYYNTLPKQTFAKNNNKTLQILNRIAICNMKLGNAKKAKEQFRKCLFYSAGDSTVNDDKLLPNSTPADNSSYYYWHDFINKYTHFIQNEYLKNNTYCLNDVIECYLNDLNSLNNKIFIKSDISNKFMFSSMAKKTSMQLLNFLATQDNIPDSIIDKVWNIVAFSKNNYLNSELSKENTELNFKTDEQNRYDSLSTQFDILSNSTENSPDIIVKQLNCYKDIFVLSYNKKAELLYPSIKLDVCIDSSIANIVADESIIDYYSNDSNIYYFTFVDSKKEFHNVNNASKVLNTIKSVSRSIKSGDETKGDKDKTLIKKLGLDIVLKHNKSLYFIPDNNMATFPIEVLKYNNGKYIAETNNISYLYSINQLTKKESDNNFKNEISCFAPGFLQQSSSNSIPEYGVNREPANHHIYLTPLPYSIEECEKIDSVFREKHSTSLRLNRAATTTNFFKEISNSKILHIATHGTASKNTLNKTGIYLYNDTLGIDFITFDKIKTDKIKTELTVLSACKTAEGVNINGEGKMSLSYGFMFAGSKNVIASLWYVSDKVTQQLMMKFYENIENDKMNYSTALQNAKIDLINQGYSSLDWGSFIILGKR